MFGTFGKLRPYDCAVPGTSELNLTVSSPRENLPKYAFARPLKSYVLLYSMDLCVMGQREDMLLSRQSLILHQGK